MNPVAASAAWCVRYIERSGKISSDERYKTEHMERDLTITSKRLAVLGASPRFQSVLHVGRPNMGSRERLLERLNDMLDRRWFSNNGPFVQEFEAKVASIAQTEHCVAMCNATVALEIAIRALELTGEVILPSYTFVATANALQWQEITPVFADIDLDTYTLAPQSVEGVISSKTSAILGVHLWGRACNTEALEKIGREYGLKVMYDAAHALACSGHGAMVGSFGECEIFSFHATKFINAFEGGAVVTNNGDLAGRMRFMRNFGFSGYDKTSYLGVNGKMTEACAAMGLTSLESLDDIVEVNKANYEAYERCLAGIEGVTLIRYEKGERNNYQYIVLEIDPDLAPLSRDEIVAVFHAENVLARKYFWPGCHRMEPYRSLQPNAGLLLPNTERVASRVCLLPTGQGVDAGMIEDIVEVLETAFGSAGQVKDALRKKDR
jgi:dTDP-4-amino-4,6-dideoxygalactose transaminase